MDSDGDGPTRFLSVGELQALRQSAVFTSDWLTVDQARIDRFAAATGDHQFIHVDPIRAAGTPFGGTIAHGLLILSLLPAFSYAALPTLADRRLSVNYGYDKIRFLNPVRSGARVRARFTIVDVVERKPERWQFIVDATVEIEGETKAALAARSISLIYSG